MTKQNSLSPHIHIKDSFNGLSNVKMTFYLRREDFKPTLEWAKNKIETSLQSIGNRYITYNNKEYSQLNTKVETQTFFNFLSKEKVTFSQIFIQFITEMKDDGFSSFFPRYYEYQKIFNRYKEITRITNIVEEKRKEYTFFKDNDLDLTRFYASQNVIKNFVEYICLIENNKKIIFDDVFLNLLHEVDELMAIAERLSEKISSLSPFDDYGFRYISTFKYYYNVYFYHIIHVLKHYKFNSSGLRWNINKENQFTSYLFKHTLIVGEAMSGKTHMLSDIANERAKEDKPTILIYAQKFEGYKTPIQHIISQLGLEQYQYADDEFLQMLDNWGKRAHELVFLIIDAINETTDKNVWKNNFIEFVSSVKKYTHIALIMSIRDVEKRNIFNEDMNNFIKKEMIEIEHKGFDSIEYPVLKKFCKVFEIKMPSFPLISPIFSNPELLFLFFETMKRNNLNTIDERVLKPNFIIEEYVKDRNIHFKQLNSITDRRTFIHRGTNIIASEMVQENFKEEISYDNIHDDIGNIHVNLLDYLLSEGILLENSKYLDETFVYFSYQRFGNYFLALYLLDKDIDINNVSNKEIIRNLFLNYTQHQALVEALIIRLSETNKLDFIDIFPELFEDNDLNFIRYKCFSKALVLPTSISNKIHNILNLDVEEKYKILDLLLHSAHEKSNQFNMQQILHLALLPLNMSERDYHWSIYLHYSYSDDGIVKRIINWAWDKKEEFEIEDESLYLYGLTLGWFLTSSNRELRDGTTKALVNLFTDNVNVFLKVLKEFETVDDLYVLERLYAVGYGIVLRSSNENGFKEFGEYAYQTIFNRDKVVEHIFLRDYAKSIVETINKKITLNVDLEKIYPPYNQNIHWKLPEISKSEVEKYYDNFSSLYMSLLNGDFKKYIVYSLANHFLNLKIKNRPHPKMPKVRYDEFFNSLTPEQKMAYDKAQPTASELLARFYEKFEDEITIPELDMSEEDTQKEIKLNEANFKELLSEEQLEEYNDFIVGYKPTGSREMGIQVKYVKRLVFLEAIKLGWKKEFFEDFERNANYGRGRETGTERIGKKYQWIALYKVLSKLVDNYEFREESYGEKIVDYKGAYQLSFRRDIDPTSILKNKYQTENKAFFNLDKSFQNLDISDKDWMSSTDKLPTIKQLVHLKKEEKEFLNLHFTFSIDGDENGGNYRNLYYHIDAFVIKKDSIESFTKWLDSVNYYGQDKLPSTSSLHDMYLREYPDSDAFKHLDTDYHGQVDWEDGFARLDTKIPSKILLTSTSYMNEGRSYDKSVDETIEIALPHKWLVEEMHLKQTLVDGEWKNQDDEVVFYDPTLETGNMSTYNENGALVADKKLLMEFLDSKGYSLVWVMWGEKQVRSSGDGFNEDEFLGIAVISGYGYFEGDEFVEKIDIKYNDRG